ncbi:MAG: peptidase M20 [Verrucomicrobia bacterium Tous-C9LFEB]|nr:MAG: peptidase M20 [Verrucomicrobia bacterium Tous-C9LFEB]
MSTTPHAIDEFLQLLRFASISADSKFAPQMTNCAEWLQKKLTAIGLHAEVAPTQGQPVVLARNAAKPGRPTVLIYGHYDVQPVDPLNLWQNDPFDPTIRDGVVNARGSSDNKGQIFAHILGVEAALKQGELPVNLIFLIEGEEEIGSPSLAPFLEAHKQELACDVVVISDSPMIAPGTPTLCYGLRGIQAIEITLRGPDKDLHSGMFGGAVLNPLTALARLLTTLHNPDFSVSILNFYDSVRPLQPWESEAWKKLPYQEKEILAITGVPELDGEWSHTPLERLWARPTAEINGMWGGYQGEGSKTVIPSLAHAKLTFRLVPDQQPEEILALVEKHLRAHLPDSVKMEIEVGHGGAAYLTDPHDKWGRAAQTALKTAFGGREPALIREGGSIPIVADFKRILGVDTLLLGLCLSNCNAHSPNETFPLSHLDVGCALNQELLRELAKAS